MAQLRTGTLSANAQTFTLDVGANEQAFITMTITSTITVTWTVAALGGANFIALRKQDDTAAAAYTASNYLVVDKGPCRVVATASGVTGGTCAIEARRSNIN